MNMLSRMAQAGLFVGPRNRVRRFFSPRRHLMLFFECACGKRRFDLPPSTNPSRLICDYCGRRSPSLRQAWIEE